MIRINKQISLEPFKSRIPSYYDSIHNDSNIQFDSNSINNTIGNYGMIPKNIKFTDSDDYGLLKGKILSWYNACKLYNFMDKINTTLILNTECGNIIDDKILDIYNEYGGDNTYEFLCNDIFNLYKIPFGEGIELSAYYFWGCTHLTINDGIKWLKWFNDIENKTDCCSNNEYENRGGKAMHEWLNNQFSDVSISDKKNYIDEPSINIPIYISNNINNIGNYKYIDKNDDNIDDISSYNDNTLTGWVESKLSLFLSNKLVIDNVGNEFNATYPQNGIIEQGCELGLPYERFCIKNYRSNNDGSFYCDVLSDIVTDIKNEECTITYLFNALLKKTDKYNENAVVDYRLNTTLPLKPEEQVELEDGKWSDSSSKYNIEFVQTGFIETKNGTTVIALYAKNDEKPYIYKGIIEYNGKKYDSWGEDKGGSIQSSEKRYLTDKIVIKQLYEIDDSYSIKYTETFTYNEVKMDYYTNDKKSIPVKVKVLNSKNVSNNGIPLAQFEFTKRKLNLSFVSIIDVQFDEKKNKWDAISPSLKKTFDKYEIIEGKVILYRKGYHLEPYYYQGTIEYDGKEYDSWQKQGDEFRVLTEKVINTYKEYSIFRDEYIGLSDIENIDENIYINRGYANAFKPHLALQEVKTMESLMQYGNNVFNIEN